MTRKKQSENGVEDVPGMGKVIHTMYRVKTKGFNKQYSSYGAALKDYNKLQSKALKDERAFTIILSQKDGREWAELDKAVISKTFYDSN